MVSDRSTSWLGLFLWCALCLAATLAACTHRENPRFPHQVHLTELSCGRPDQPRCLSCATCHAPSQEGRLAKLPQQALCTQCHEKQAARMARVLHARPERPYGEITFNHDVHLRMKDIEGQCVPCHGGVVGEGTDNLPNMNQCLSCHEHEQQWKQATCEPCHRRADLERTLPVTFMRHDQAFLLDHAALAASQEALCKSCHTQSDCQSCHDLTQMIGVDRRLPEKFETKQLHRGDFMARHAIEAVSQPARCVRCHEPASCDACHLERGVSGNGMNGRNPHPPGWVGPNVGSKDFHGRAARRDLVSCAGCHEAGPFTNCIRCHKVGGYGGNPHPGGWRSARSTGETMCAYCHGGGP